MWTADRVRSGSVVKLGLSESGQPMTWQRVLDQWQRPEFADWFSVLLADSEWPAFFWECPPITLADLEQPFEFVLVNSPGLALVSPDPGPFAGQFWTEGPVASFQNLGGDAFLVAPCPGSATEHSAHLAAFLRGANAEVKRALWAAVSEGVVTELGRDKLWLSTCGLGVYWVHIRLDRRPKYYSHGPYRHR